MAPLWLPLSRASAKKFPGGGTEKIRPKNSTIKPLSTLSVPSMKIQGGTASPSVYATNWYSMLKKQLPSF